MIYLDTIENIYHNPNTESMTKVEFQKQIKLGFFYNNNNNNKAFQNF